MLTVLTGDAIEQLRTLPSESVQCCVTSPPYWGLRDYGTAAWEGGTNGCDHLQTNDTRDPAWCKQTQNAGTSQIGFKESCGKCGAKRIDSQLGLEKTPEEYVAKMVTMFREVRRVLRKDGTLWLNLGDSYASASACDRRSIVGNGSPDENCKRPNRLSGTLKEKDMCGIPWRVAFALQADGWWLRSDIIWAKPNPMPESVTDRPTKSHEYLFLLTKSASYFYDAEAIKERVGEETRRQKTFRGGCYTNNTAFDNNYDYSGHEPYSDGEPSLNGRNKRSVWTVATAPYPEAHFATYPPDLIKPCILAGTSARGCCERCGAPWERVLGNGSIRKLGHSSSRKAKEVILQYRGEASVACSGLYSNETCEKITLGWKPTCKCQDMTLTDYITPLIEPCTVLDPFAGSGTTGMVALELGRKALLIELNPKYCELIRQRCDITPGLQLA